jgi:glutamyl-tRNA reductase
VLILSHVHVSFSSRNKMIFQHEWETFEDTRGNIKLVNTKLTTQTVLVTRHRTKIYKTKTQRRKLKRWATRTPPTNGVNSGDLEEKAVPVYYKTQSASRHVTPLGHIILIQSQPVFALTPLCCLAKKVNILFTWVFSFLYHPLVLI